VTPIRGPVRAVATFVTLLPVHLSHRLATARRRALRAFAGARPKAVAMLVALGLVALAAVTAGPVVLGVSVLALLLLGGTWAAGMLQRPVGLFLLSRRTFPLDGITPARETLALLGLDEPTIGRVMAEVDAGREVCLARFDQENRLVSDVGHIPYFASTLIRPDEFIPRLRHRLELVVAFGVVAIRKAYQSPVSIQNEALSLAAIAHLEGVPRIVRLEWRTRVMYQSFLPGDNLGSLMTSKGSSVMAQHHLATDRPRPGTWTKATIVSPQRVEALRSLAEVTPQGCVAELSRLIERVHEAGVALGDIKYGNVLLQRGRPVLCDFDWSRVLRPRSIPLLGRRDDERDLFNYLFDGNLPTLDGIRREVDALVATRPSIADAAVDAGAGIRFGREWSLDRGTGRWRVVRRQLPHIVGRAVFDLGSDDPVILVEMLRSGASKVFTLQPDETGARFARALHRLVEHVDNRRYAFRAVVTNSVPVVTEGPAFELATLFAGPGLRAADLAARLDAMPAATRQVVVQADGDAGIAGLLEGRGFRVERTFAPAYLTQSLVVATR
jgi:hypothetical protein